MNRFLADTSYQRLTPDLAMGGVPLRLFRLGRRGGQVMDRIERGEHLPSGHQPLTDRLLDAGAVHPRPDRGPFTEADVTLVMPAHGAAPRTPPHPGVAGTVIVDDASAAPIDVAAPAHAWPVTVVRRPTNGGPAAARNTGLAEVTTPLVAFLDADVDADPAWLRGLLGHFADSRVALVAPRVRSAPAPSLVARYDRDRSPLDLGPLPSPVRPGSRVSYVPAAALVCRVDAVRSIGGFDESRRVGEDVDLVWRLVEAGWRCRYEPTVEVQHQPRSTVAAMLRQRFVYGTSAAPLAARHPGAAPAVRMSGWTMAVWALLAARRPVTAATLAVGTAAALQRKLVGVPARVSWRLAIGGHARAGAVLAAAVRRPWWPVAAVAAVGGRHGRAGLLAAMAPLLWAYRRTPRRLPAPVWVALAAADDAAYGLGVWRGAVAERCPAPLLPDYRSAR